MGVEIFFFLSGMGLVLSWQKDSNPFHYYRKRILRLLPSYYIAIAFIIFLSNFWGHTDDRMYSSFFVIGPWMWFVSYLFVLYIVFPLYMYISAKVPPEVLFMLVVSATMATMTALWYFLPDNTFPYLDMKVGRIPSFFFGCLAAQRRTLLNSKPVWGIIGILAIAALFCCFRLDEHNLKMTGVVWMIRLLLTPGLCFLLIAVCTAAEKLHLHFLLKCLAFIGTLTLEIYLTESFFSEELRCYYPLILQPIGWVPCLMTAYIINRLSQRVRAGVDTFLSRAPHS